MSKAGASMMQSMSDPNGAWARDEAGRAQAIVDDVLLGAVEAQNTQREPPLPPRPPGPDDGTPPLHNATAFGNVVFPDKPVEGALCLTCGIVERRRHSWFCREECEEAYIKRYNVEHFRNVENIISCRYCGGFYTYNEQLIQLLPSTCPNCSVKMPNKGNKNRCKGCGRKMTFAEKKVQYKRYLKQGDELASSRCHFCQKCNTLHNTAGFRKPV